MAGCPLARVNHALAMNEEEIANHFDAIHYEVQAYKKQLENLNLSKGFGKMSKRWLCLADELTTARKSD
jgi:hypothetical protein